MARQALTLTRTLTLTLTQTLILTLTLTLTKVENITDLGSAFGFASKYNGKPALITKSGQIAQVQRFSKCYV